MCGRYYIELNDPGLERMAKHLESSLSQSGRSPKLKIQGEIFPSDVVPVQTAIDSYRAMQWGFRTHGKRLIINARSETVEEKPLFREAVSLRRCLVPASGYYEWQSLEGRKVRYKFFLPGEPLFLAAFYREEKENPLPAFVILTREAGPGFSHIHRRMPVIIPENQMEIWLDKSASAMNHPVTDLLFQISRP